MSEDITYAEYKKKYKTAYSIFLMDYALIATNYEGFPAYTQDNDLECFACFSAWIAKKKAEIYATNSDVANVFISLEFDCIVKSNAFECIDANLGDLAVENYDIGGVICNVCAIRANTQIVPHTAFVHDVITQTPDGTEVVEQVAFCDSCRKYIDKKGNLCNLKEYTCPSCGEKKEFRVDYNDADQAKRVCNRCKVRKKDTDDVLEILTEADKTKLLIDSKTQEAVNKDLTLKRIESHISTILTVLYTLYSYYWSTLEKPRGIIGTDSKHTCLISFDTNALVYKELHLRSHGSSKVALEQDMLSYFYDSLVTAEPNEFIGNKNYISSIVLDSRSSYTLDTTDITQHVGGWHLPHLLGYVISNTGLESIEGISKNDFEAKFKDIVKLDILKCILKDSKGLLPLIKDIQKKIANFNSSTDDASKKQAATDAFDASYMKLSEALVAFLAKYITHITTMYVLVDDTPGSVKIDIAGRYGPMKACRDALKAVGELTLKKTLAGATVDSVESMEKVSIVYNDINAKSPYVFSYTFVTDDVKYTGLPLFAYKPMNILKAKGQLNPENVLLGRTLDGNPFFLENAFKCEFLTLEATSRAGKGVCTLSMLGSVLASPKYTTVYVDAKPEMALLMSSFEYTINKRLAERGSDQKVHFLSLETAKHADSRSAWYNAIKPEVVDIVRQRQRNWIRAVDSEEGIRQMAEKWDEFFKVPGTFKAVVKDSYFIGFLFYSKIVQLLSVYGYESNLSDKVGSILGILDELNTYETAKLCESLALQQLIQLRLDFKATQVGKDAESKQLFADFDKRLNNFLKLFIGTIRQQAKYLDAGTDNFTSDLRNRRNKKEANAQPTFIMIGQTRSRCQGNSGSNHLRLDAKDSGTITWMDYFFQMANSKSSNAIQIQGNWNSGEDTEPCNADLFTPEIKASPEYKSKYIHAGLDGKSGFFIVRKGKAEPKIVQTYLVLNENTEQYTDCSSSSVRGRVATAFDGDVLQQQAALASLEETLYYVRDPEGHTDIDMNSWKRRTTKLGDEVPPDTYTLKDGKVKQNRIPAVGFEGYIYNLCDIDIDDTSSESDSKFFKFAEAFGSSYERLWSVFKESAVCKFMGYTCIEDYIYDLTPWTFLTNDEILETNPDRVAFFQEFSGGSTFDDDYDADSADSDSAFGNRVDEDEDVFANPNNGGSANLDLDYDADYGEQLDEDEIDYDDYYTDTSEIDAQFIEELEKHRKTLKLILRRLEKARREDLINQRSEFYQAVYNLTLAIDVKLNDAEMQGVSADLITKYNDDILLILQNIANVINLATKGVR